MICAKLAPLASGTVAAWGAWVAAWGAWPARAESGWSQLNMPRGVTEISRKIYDLHMEIFWVCVAIAAVVFGAMIWSILTYSKSRGAIPDGTLVHNTKVEFIWTVVPVIILIAMPVGTKVRLLVTAADVIHSWWVPEFGVKKDAIPGFVNEAWFRVDTDKPGLYRGQCAELCGRDHAFMPIVVDVRSKADFATWLKDKAARAQAAAPPAAPPVTPSAAPAAPTTASAATAS